VKIISATAALPGQPCTNSCVTDYRCDVGGTNVCVAYPQLGMSCEKERTCGGGSYCELAGLICKAQPGKDAPCGVDGFTGQATYCASGLACHQSTPSMGVCETPPALGEACWLDQQGYSCWGDTTCDLSQQPPVCSARGGPGADCTTGGQLTCMSNLSCMCAPGTPPGITCETRSCYALRFAGENCDEPGSACHPAFACAAGKCVPKDSQGLFVAACMP